MVFRAVVIDSGRVGADFAVGEVGVSGGVEVHAVAVFGIEVIGEDAGVLLHLPRCPFAGAVGSGAALGAVAVHFDNFISHACGC